MSKSPREVLAENNWDVGMLRPYLDKNGKSVVTKALPVGPGGERRYEVVPSEIPALNTKEEMIEIDRVTLRGAKFRLSITHTLLGHGGGVLKYDGSLEKAKTILRHEHPEVSEEDRAFLAEVEQKDDGKLIFNMESLPLPITYSPWKMKDGKPLNTVMPGASGRRVGESIEQLVTGNEEPFDNGKGGKIYGLLNHPGRTIVTLDDSPLVDQIDAAIKLLEAKKFYGKYFMFHGNKFDVELDSAHTLIGDVDHPNYGETITAREAVRKISRKGSPTRSSVSLTGKYLGQVPQNPIYYPVIDCKRMDWADNDIAIVQATPDVIRIVLGLDITTVRWEDGYQTWAIIVPQIRADFYGNVGIAHLRRG